MPIPGAESAPAPQSPPPPPPLPPVGGGTARRTDPVLASIDADIAATLRALRAECAAAPPPLAAAIRAVGAGGPSAPLLGLEAGGVSAAAALAPPPLVLCDGTVVPRDPLGRFPPWIPGGVGGWASGGGGSGVGAVVPYDPGAAQAVVPPTPGVAPVEAAAEWGPMAIFHPAYGRREVTFAVRVPRPLLDAAAAAAAAAAGASGPLAAAMAASGRRCVMTAGGQVWRDRTLEEWPAGDARLFVGDLGPHTTDRDLTEAFRAWPGFNMARVAYDWRRGRCRGFGFVSFATAAAAEAVLRHQRRAAAIAAGGRAAPGTGGRGHPARGAPAALEEEIYVRGRPVVVKRSKWAQRLLTPESMPQVVALGRAREELEARGLVDPDAAPMRARALRRALRRAGIAVRPPGQEPPARASPGGEWPPD
jgi:hypothetical protein